MAAQARSAITPGDSPRKGHIPFSADSKKALELALREAIRLKHRHIGTEHILLALLRDDTSEGGKVLTGLGVRRDQVEEYVLAESAG
jgi:ATP-dependent Clp protease ATP-binding subunit ClpC